MRVLWMSIPNGKRSKKDGGSGFWPTFAKLDFRTAPAGDGCQWAEKTRLTSEDNTRMKGSEMGDTSSISVFARR
jgi:hypothetical protein